MVVVTRNFERTKTAPLQPPSIMGFHLQCFLIGLEQSGEGRSAVQFRESAARPRVQPFGLQFMTEERFERLFCSLRSDTENAQLRHLGDRLRVRLARSLDLFPLAAPSFSTMDTTHTERANRILLLWLDLHRALRDAERALPPWECPDKTVARLWGQLTDPRNEHALEEWLCQSAEGQPAAWARQALQVCRERRAK